MTEREILLPLEREYTDKEQIGLLIQQNQNLIDQLNNGSAVNMYLKNKIGMLNREVYLNNTKINDLINKLKTRDRVYGELEFAHNVLKSKYETYKENMKKTVFNQVIRQKKNKYKNNDIISRLEKHQEGNGADPQAS